MYYITIVRQVNIIVQYPPSDPNYVDDSGLFEVEVGRQKRHSSGWERIGEYTTQAELDQAIEKLRGEPVFAVFENSGACEIFWTQEDNLTGNWRGTKVVWVVKTVKWLQLDRV